MIGPAGDRDGTGRWWHRAPKPVRIPGGMELALTVDTLVSGIHFPASTCPEDLGYKAMAVNLSDLAAMGARPAWAVMSLTIPGAEQGWLDDFSNGTEQLARRFDVAITATECGHGPLSVTIQMAGHLPEGTALRRSGAVAGDRIWVTGSLGDAALSLALDRGGLAASSPDATYLHERLARPTPRVEAGLALRGLASSCIDISDGLAADLGHILAASGVGATLRVTDLPLSEALKRTGKAPESWRAALSGGDDYELCFSASEKNAGLILKRFEQLDCRMTEVGVIEDMNGLRCVLTDGQAYIPEPGYEHFT